MTRAVSFLSTAVLLVLAPAGAAADWEEDFDSYGQGSGIIYQGGWEPWHGMGGDVDAYIDGGGVCGPRSGPNCLKVVGTSDVVHQFEGYTEGQWTFTAWQCIPPDFEGETYFILLNTYGGDMMNWSTQVRFDDEGFVDSENEHAQLPLILGEWVEIRVEIDLDADIQTVYYDCELLSTKSWRHGVSGDGALNIAAVDLYGNGASPVYYDDLSLRSYQPRCPGDLDCDNDTDQADLGILLSSWGVDDGGDLDGDGVTGHSDLGILLADWGCGVP